MGRRKVMMIDEYQPTAADDYKDGMLTVLLSSWDGFSDALAKFEPYKDYYIWRGQSQDKPLLSSFDRLYPTNRRDRNEVLKRHLDNFREKMQQCHPQVPLSVDEDFVWAVGQHYRLVGPVLDWTRNPCIAAYFAFEEARVSEDNGFRCIYGLNRSIRRLMIKWKRGGVESRERSARTEDLPPGLLPLFRAQEAVFTKAERGRSIEETVRAWSRKRGREITLVKIRIPGSERRRFLDELKHREIDYGKLLLVLSDATCECNRDLKRSQQSGGCA